MNEAAADLLEAAYLAEAIASELAAAADYLGKKGNAVVARALLEEARRHTVQCDPVARPIGRPALPGCCKFEVDQAHTTNGSAPDVARGRAKFPSRALSFA